MQTTTLLPYASVSTYDGHVIGKNNVRSKTFATVDDAMEWLEREGFKLFNLYRIDKVNGTWRTDWELIH